MIRRPPRSTLDRSSAASDVYKRQVLGLPEVELLLREQIAGVGEGRHPLAVLQHGVVAVSYTHLRAHETVLDLVCRLLLAQKNTN